MRVILFGATGMIGSGVLIECLADARVESVLCIGRKPSGVTHPRVRNLVRDNLDDLSDVRDQLRGHDACFYCLGVSSVGLGEAEYSRITFDLTLAAARALAEVNPGSTFCYVSGGGSDASERGRVMWARVKGRTENALLALPLNAWMFRPGYIQPRKGVRSKTAWYQAFYTVMGPFYPVLRLAFGSLMTTTENVGRAMIAVAAAGAAGADRRLLENDDINRIAART